MKKMKKSEFLIFHRIFNNALRGLPRGNKVDGLPRGSSCSSPHADAPRPRAADMNPWRTTQRIAMQMLVVGARARSALLRKLWS